MHRLSVTLGATVLVWVNAFSQTQQTFYRTNTTYESFQLDKAPFAKKQITVAPTDASITIADITFYKSPLKNGGAIYLSNDRKSYLLVIEKDEQVGFIVSPDGKEWSCYFRYKKARKDNNIPPDDLSNDEVAYLKEALGNIVDPREHYYYLTSYTYDSKSNTSFADDSLSIIPVSDDSIKVNGNIFVKKADKLFRTPSTYLFFPDNETIVFRAFDNRNWASFYKIDNSKATEVISRGYKSDKEFSAANAAIDKLENAKTQNVLASYFGNLRSLRNDPATTNSILNYWKTHAPSISITKVVFVDADFYITRNTLGEPLRKTITAWVFYRSNGKCFGQWHEYGYEAVGGGNFDKSFSQWTLDRSHHINAQTSQGSEYFHSGDEIEIDCSILK